MDITLYRVHTLLFLEPSLLHLVDLGGTSLRQPLPLDQHKFTEKNQPPPPPPPPIQRSLLWQRTPTKFNTEGYWINWNSTFGKLKHTLAPIWLKSWQETITVSTWMMREFLTFL